MTTMAKTRTTIPFSDPRTVALMWQTRCRDLADAHHLTATLHGHSIRGIHLYSVPSTSRPGAVHLVRYHVVRRQIECDCLAAKHQLACGHAGAVLATIERAERYAAEQSDQWRWWMAGGEW